ncbi:hypothetical protein OFN17_25745, partial [Escherichia coli]|nr:hypothetical protein [Escherichia coli]
LVFVDVVLSDQREAVGINDLCHNSFSCFQVYGLSIGLPPFGFVAVNPVIVWSLTTFRIFF